MPNGDLQCTEHSGCIARLGNLETSDRDQWEKMEKLDDRVDSIMTRLNVVLGSLVVACFLLVLNIIIKAI